jgi:hypothetical protein
MLYVPVAGTVQNCIPLVVLKKLVSFFHPSTPVPVKPVLAVDKLGPSRPVVPPGVNVALVKVYKGGLAGTFPGSTTVILTWPGPERVA